MIWFIIGYMKLLNCVLVIGFMFCVVRLMVRLVMVVLFSGVFRMWLVLKCCCRLVVVWNMLLLMFMFLFSISIDLLCFSF